ncbi:MAG: biopolymer transporter ExbD [Cytophagales bacterium]|nr:biopolymer transporter ExbD [Cytophagales bacterium]
MDFILMATASVAGIQVNLPKASNIESISASDTIAVSVTADGQIYMNGFPVTRPQFESQMRRIHAGNPDIPVVVRGDTQTAYGRVMEVLDTLKGIGVTKIGLPAEEITT